LYHDKRTFKEIDENLHQLDEDMVSDEEWVLVGTNPTLSATPMSFEDLSLTSIFTHIFLGPVYQRQRKAR
jgi:hypothetical protein